MEEEARTKSLTKAELNLMNILWDKGEATVNELIDKLPEPKPAYTTILTVMQVLTKNRSSALRNAGRQTHIFPDSRVRNISPISWMRRVTFCSAGRQSHSFRFCAT